MQHGKVARPAELRPDFVGNNRCHTALLVDCLDSPNCSPRAFPGSISGCSASLAFYVNKPYPTAAAGAFGTANSVEISSAVFASITALRTDSFCKARANPASNSR